MTREIIGPVAEPQALLALARRAISHALTRHSRWLPDPADYPASWQVSRATFVTLKTPATTEDGAKLRGCIGTLEALDPLVISVARNACAAAFEDPRFPALSAAELLLVRISISVLTPAEELDFNSEDELLARLTSSLDGLIISRDERKATFLPSVWESFDDPRQFLAALKSKADIAPHETVSRAWRYRSTTVAESGNKGESAGTNGIRR